MLASVKEAGGDLSLDDFNFDIIFCGFDSKQTTSFALGPPKSTIFQR